MLTTKQQQFFDWALNSIPDYLREKGRTKELLNAFAVMLASGDVGGSFLGNNSLIIASDGELNFPDYLALHAADRGTSRRSGETDQSLRDRIRNVEDALTLPTLKALVDALLLSLGVVGESAFLELRPDKAFMGSYVDDQGTSGSIVQSGVQSTMTPQTAFAAPMAIGDSLVLSGASNAGNNGTFTVTALDGAGVVYTNPLGVSESSSFSWTAKAKTLEGFDRGGFSMSYLSRGYRMSNAGPSPIPTIVVILPFGCTTATESAVAEILRLKVAAGVRVVTECRLNP